MSKRPQTSKVPTFLSGSRAFWIQRQVLLLLALETETLIHVVRVKAHVIHGALDKGASFFCPELRLHPVGQLFRSKCWRYLIVIPTINSFGHWYHYSSHPEAHCLSLSLWHVYRQPPKHGHTVHVFFPSGEVRPTLNSRVEGYLIL